MKNWYYRYFGDIGEFKKVEEDKNSPCLFWGMVPYTTKTTFEIQVFELEGTVEIPLFTKELKLPACKDVD